MEPVGDSRDGEGAFDPRGEGDADPAIIFGSTSNFLQGECELFTENNVCACQGALN